MHEQITLTRELGQNTWIVDWHVEEDVPETPKQARFTINEMHGFGTVGRGTEEDAGRVIRTLELVVQGASSR